MTPEQMIQAILSEYDLNEDSFVSTVIYSWFNLYADKSDLYLQYLYTKKRVLAYLIYKASKRYDKTIGGDTLKRSQTAGVLQSLLKDLNDEIFSLDPHASVPTLSVSLPYSSLPDAMEEYLDSLVNSYWDGKR